MADSIGTVTPGSTIVIMPSVTIPVFGWSLQNLGSFGYTASYYQEATLSIQPFQQIPTNFSTPYTVQTISPEGDSITQSGYLTFNDGPALINVPYGVPSPHFS